MENNKVKTKYDWKILERHETIASNGYLFKKEHYKVISFILQSEITGDIIIEKFAIPID
jgi:hypothetical protein